MNKAEKQYIFTLTSLDEFFSSVMLKTHITEEIIDFSNVNKRIDKLNNYFEILEDDVTDEGIEFIKRELNDSINEITSYIELLELRYNEVSIKRTDVRAFYNYRETLIRHKTRLERLI